MSKRDYYTVLGVERNATEKEIKKAYRTLAKENHPDVKPNDAKAEELFKEAAEAYEVLSDSGKKAQYDQFGHTGNQRQQQSHGYEDILKDFMGRQQGRRPVRKGADLRINIKLELEEMFSGEHKKIKYRKMNVCTPCNGKGGHKTDICDTCRGLGSIFRTRTFGNHVIQEQSHCPTCQGAGERISDTCKTCNGGGLVSEEVLLDIDIPAGVTDGMRLIQEGGGHGIKDGVNGDVVILLTQKPHKLFNRSGNDLKYNLKLSYSQLILGDKVEVPTIEGGKIRVTIPPHSNVGDNLRVPNKGMNILNANRRGDMTLTLLIIIPKTVTDEEKELLNKLDELQNKVAP